MRPLRTFTCLLATALLSATAAAQGVGGFGYSRGNKGNPQAPQSDAPAPRQEKQFPLGASWTAVSLNGKPFGGERPSFILDQTLRVKGFGGCNTFSATAYPLREQGFAVGPFALTKKSCDKGVMATEQAFLVALRTAAKWDVQGPTLVIRSQNGELRFEKSL